MLPIELKIPMNGYSLDADWYDGSTDEVLLVLIGYSSNKAKYIEIISYICSKTGSSALVLDYSGHGESPFELDEIMPAQNFIEVVAAYDWIKENYTSKKINVMGASYGGFLASQLVKYRDINKLILRVPAMYKEEDFYTKWKDYNVESGRKYRAEEPDLQNHPYLQHAKNYKNKTLVVVHELDDICPENTTTAFINAFGAKSWVAKGFRHGFSESDITEEQKQEYYRKITEWLM